MDKTVLNYFKGHNICYFNDLTSSPSGDVLAIAGSNNNVYVIFKNIHPNTGENMTRISKLKGHTKPVTSVSFDPSSSTTLASGSEDGTIIVWSFYGERIDYKLTGFYGKINSVSYSPDGSRIAAGSSDMTIFIWDISNRSYPTKFYNMSSVNSISWSPDGTHIAAGGNNGEEGTLCIWDINTEVQNILNLPIHVKKIISVSYSPDGSNIVSGSFDGAIHIWDVHTGTASESLNHMPNSQVNCVSYSPDGSLIIAGISKRVCIFNAHTKILQKMLLNDGDNVTSAFISNSQLEPCIYAYNGKINLWKMSEINNTSEITNIPRITNNFLKKDNSFEYIENFISNYNTFKEYIDKVCTKNNMIEFNSSQLFYKIFNSKLNLNQDNINKFLNYIVRFFKSYFNNNNSKNNSKINSRNKGPYGNVYIKHYNSFISNYLFEFYERNYNKKFTFGEFKYINLNRGSELSVFLNLININNIKLDFFTKEFNIKYNNENGINSGGLRRDFFINVGNQLNENIINNNINTNTQLIKKIFILGVSKRHSEPIYLYNDTVLKEELLNKISGSFRTEIKKNLFLNILNNEPIVNYIMNEMATEINFKKLINSNNTNYMNYENKIPFKTIDILINIGIYKDYLDFYLSHFYKNLINKELLIKRLNFDYKFNINLNDKIEFEKKFIKLINSLSEEELSIFNKVITGSPFIKGIYEITIYNSYPNNTKVTTVTRRPVYHTCFNQMEIQSYSNFQRIFLCGDEDCKKNFVDTLNETFLIKEFGVR